jgi:hypothetical protein
MLRSLLAHAWGECNLCLRRADVAQLVEQRFRKPQVTGSNPVVGCLDCGLRIDWTLIACSRKLSELDRLLAKAFGVER